MAKYLDMEASVVASLAVETSEQKPKKESEEKEDE